MVNLLAVLIFLFGFLSPYFFGFLSLYFFNLPSGISPELIFCIGFLLLFKANKQIEKVSVWLKWGQIGILINIFGFFLSFLFNMLLLQPQFSFSYLGYVLWVVFNWIFSPIHQISEILFPREQIIMPSGMIGWKFSYLRWTLTSFFDVFFYIVFAIVIGKLVSTIKLKKHQEV